MSASRASSIFRSSRRDDKLEGEGRMKNACVTNIRRVSQFYSPTDEPYLASFSLEQFKALSRVVPADDPFRDSDDDFRHIPHVKRPTAIFLFQQMYTIASCAPWTASGTCTHLRADLALRAARVRKRNQRVSSNSWDNCPVCYYDGMRRIRYLIERARRTCPVFFLHDNR